MTTLHIYKSTIPNVNFSFGNGKPAIFQQGRYHTNVDWEIAALDYEIAQGHPHIYKDPAELKVESEMLDPMNALKAKMRAEILAEMQAASAQANDPSNDRGTSSQDAVKPASTIDVAPAALGGSGVQLAARLANLTGGKK